MSGGPQSILLKLMSQGASIDLHMYLSSICNLFCTTCFFHELVRFAHRSLFLISQNESKCISSNSRLEASLTKQVQAAGIWSCKEKVSQKALLITRGMNLLLTRRIHLVCLPSNGAGTMSPLWEPQEGPSREAKSQ